MVNRELQIEEKRDLALQVSDMTINNLFIEKYRPKTLQDIILSRENEETFNAFKVKQEIPNILFFGPPGVGKSSLAKIIVNDILGCQYLYVNASDENGIDTIRNKVISFAQTKSIDGKIKCVILDEGDSLSIEGQRALRNTMEEYSAYTRFILTGNYKYKIIPALVSRCQSFDLTPPLDVVVKHCYNILKKENIKIAEEIKSQFVEFVKDNFPDIRKCLNELQRYSISGELKFPINQSEDICYTLYNLITTKNIKELRQYYITNKHMFIGDYGSLLRSLFNFVDENEKDEEKRKMSLLAIAEHLYRSSFVADQEINFYAACIALTALR